MTKSFAPPTIHTRREGLGTVFTVIQFLTMYATHSNLSNGGPLETSISSPAKPLRGAEMLGTFRVHPVGLQSDNKV